MTCGDNKNAYEAIREAEPETVFSVVSRDDRTCDNCFTLRYYYDYEGNKRPIESRNGPYDRRDFRENAPGARCLHCRKATGQTRPLSARSAERFATYLSRTLSELSVSHEPAILVFNVAKNTYSGNPAPPDEQLFRPAVAAAVSARK
jgi:hypothetical protein